jgi:hypothetical protein
MVNSMHSKNEKGPLLISSKGFYPSFVHTVISVLTSPVPFLIPAARRRKSGPKNPD